MSKNCKRVSGWNQPKAWHKRRFFDNMCKWYNQKGLCYYCFIPMTICAPTEQPKSRDATIEHLLPVSHGGEDALENTPLCCSKCNNHRGNSPLYEFQESEWLQKKKEGVQSQKIGDFEPLTLMQAYTAFKRKYEHSLQYMILQNKNGYYAYEEYKKSLQNV